MGPPEGTSTTEATRAQNGRQESRGQFGRCSPLRLSSPRSQFRRSLVVIRGVQPALEGVGTRLDAPLEGRILSQKHAVPDELTPRDGDKAGFRPRQAEDGRGERIMDGAGRVEGEGRKISCLADFQ